MSLTLTTLQAVADERARQDAKWGIQNHTDLEWLAILAEEFDEAAMAVTQASVQPCDAHPSLAQEAALQKELVQTAAVCIAWLECMQRRREAKS